MTQPTLVVTHADGFLGCFTREPDGTMRQRALIDTGEQPPTAVELANVGTTLAEQYGWSFGGVHEKALKNGGKALPPAKKERKQRNSAHLISEGGRVRHPDDPPPSERPALILAYLRTTPYQTMAEVVAGLGMEATQKRVSRWHHTFHAMFDRKELSKRPREGKYRIHEWYPA